MASQSRDVVQVALVGCAHIHTPNFIKRLQERADIAVAAVWDHDAARAQQNGAALGAPVRDLDTIWADRAIRAVVICAETDRHLALVLAAAAAGKDMFVEKPLGIAAAESYGMAEAIERAGVRFQTGYFKRGEAVSRFVRDHIRRGSFGTITRIRSANCHAGALKGWFDTEWRWIADPTVAGFGGFGDLGTHSLDLLLWMLDSDATRATAQIGTVTRRYGDCDEYGEGMLIFANGATGSIAAGWVDGSSHATLEVGGTEGWAQAIGGQLFFESAHVAGADGKTPWAALPEPLPHAFVLFLDAITGTPDVPLVTAREAAVRSAVMEALYMGARRGEWVVPR